MPKYNTTSAIAGACAIATGVSHGVNGLPTCESVASVIVIADRCCNDVIRYARMWPMGGFYFTEKNKNTGNQILMSFSLSIKMCYNVRGS